MIYLDYSANTPVDEAVLERFCAVERSCPGNANSRHQYVVLTCTKIAFIFVF